MRKRKYVKISVDMFENRKLKLIEKMEKRDMIEIVWIKLLLEATKTNDSGLIYLEEDIPYTTEMLSVILGRSKEDIQLALKVLINLRMIEFAEDSFLKVSSWSQHQERRSNKQVINTDDEEENKILVKNKKKVSRFKYKDGMLNQNKIQKDFLINNENNCSK